MNYSIVLYILGFILRFESVFLLLPALVGLIYQEASGFSYLFVAVLCFAVSFLLTRRKPDHPGSIQERALSRSQ